MHDTHTHISEDYTYLPVCLSPTLALTLTLTRLVCPSPSPSPKLVLVHSPSPVLLLTVTPRLSRTKSAYVPDLSIHRSY